MKFKGVAVISRNKLGKKIIQWKKPRQLTFWDSLLYFYQRQITKSDEVSVKYYLTLLIQHQVNMFPICINWQLYQ